MDFLDEHQKQRRRVTGKFLVVFEKKDCFVFEIMEHR
jgi:hypothetical protein